MKNKKDINEFFKEGLGDFRMEPPKKVRRKLLIVLFLGKLFSGYRKYVAAISLIALGSFVLFFTGNVETANSTNKNELSSLHTGTVKENSDDGVNQMTEKIINIQNSEKQNGNNKVPQVDKVDVTNNGARGVDLNERGSNNKGGLSVNSENDTANKLSKTSDLKVGAGEELINKSRTASVKTSGKEKNVKENNKVKTLNGLVLENNESIEGESVADKDANEDGKIVNQVANDKEPFKGDSIDNNFKDQKVSINSLGSTQVDSTQVNSTKVNPTPVNSTQNDTASSQDFEQSAKLDSAIIDSIDSVKIDTAASVLAKLDSINDSLVTNEAVDSSSKKKFKLGFVFAPYLAMDGALNNLDSVKYNPSYAVGVLGGISYKNNLLYVGAAYETQTFNKTFTYSVDSNVANFRTNTVITYTERVTVTPIISTSLDSIVKTDSLGTTTDYFQTTDTVYVTTTVQVPDTSVVTDTIYTVESFKKGGVQKVRLNYLSMPIYLAHSFKFGKHGVDISAGITAHVLLNSKEVLLTIPEGDKLVAEKFYIDYRVALGYSYQIRSQFALFSELRFKQVGKNSMPANSSKAQYFGASVGVRWNFD